MFYDVHFLELLKNAALLLALAFISDTAAYRLRTGQTSFRQIPIGMAIGVLGIIVMLSSWTLVPGIIFDTRSILLGISGLFFGPIPTIIAMAMTASFRIYQGGAGALMGVSVIISTGTAGIAWRYYYKRPVSEMSWKELYLFGIAIHLIMLALMLTLPWKSAIHALSILTLPVLIIYPLGTAFLGMLMVKRLQRERAEEVLHLQQNRLDLAQTAGRVGVFDWDMVTDKSVWTPQLEILYGIEPGSIEHTSEEWVKRVHPEDLNDAESRVRQCIRERQTEIEGDYRIIRPGGEVRWLSNRAVISYNASGKPVRMVGTSADITERKLAEEALHQQFTFLQTLIDTIPSPIFFKNVEGRYLGCNVAFESFIGLPKVGIVGKTPHDIAPADLAEKYHRADLDLMSKTGIQQYESAVQYADGTRHEVLFSKATFQDPAGKVAGLVGVMTDITDSKMAEMERQENMERLRRGLAATVQAISMAVETRDPYTAGHQKRVADLARAIATEMGVPADQIDFIRIAATIHDIGKISVPAEILSKPSRLSPIEFSLIKIHPETGHDILKDIDFPWPVAQVILQHHERMDGSGYPFGLKGNDILPEARIISVADVVESMASHRPYRPALGINAAMTEISMHQGTLYDSDVVDACLRLFSEKGYRLN
jgi:PAS domain S-box-containing protein/putative nucleotidyltransferase with HDIG domain